MTSLLHTVVSASRHVLWYVDWRTAGPRAVRALAPKA
jgi:hypothetical protein